MSDDLSIAQKKLVLFGPPNSGKSSILLSIFGSVEPDLILMSPNEPTFGVDASVYQWAHVRIGVFDLAGQELENWLTTEKDFVFPNTDELLIVFEYGYPIKKIIFLLHHLSKIIVKNKIPYVYVIIHKIDLAESEKSREDYFFQLKEQCDKQFGLEQLKFFGTSLFPEFLGKFKFQMEWMLTALEISIRDIKVMKAVPVSESLLKSLRTSGFIGDGDDEGLAELPEINPEGFNEMKSIKNERIFSELKRDKD